MVRSEVERSLLSVIVYLTAVDAGGETLFFDEFDPTADDADDEPPRAAVRPQLGSALCFPHEARHAGAPVSRGQKYALRTDVMYARPAPSAVDEDDGAGAPGDTGSDRCSE
eukprot:5430837-Prymnesium_polylepis.1